MNPSSERNPAHDLVDRIVGHEGVDFDFEWEGTRVPQTVVFPDGSSREVGYMRDGIMNFQDGTVAKYERVVDDLNQPKQKIKILLILPDNNLSSL